MPLFDAYWQQPLKEQGEKPKDWPHLWKDLQPSSCASCHQEQHQAWQHSLHANAFSPGLYGQFSTMSAREANACLNCHTPLAEQKFSTDLSLKDSLKTPQKHALRKAGVSCAGCHVRKWQRFGPPPKGSNQEGLFKTGVHGGFIASKDFEKSTFCASCHQFPKSWGTVNGKAMENTLNEWKASRFAKENVHCQNCHMPERKHLFKGIHDSKMTRKGLKIKVFKRKEGAELSLTSEWIGHAFPTYITPKVYVQAIATSKDGTDLQAWEWVIFRDVRFNQAWVEKSDTRLMPNETRRYVVKQLPAQTTQLIFRIRVEPDFYYKGLYKNLLTFTKDQKALSQLREALSLTYKNDYTLFEQTLLFKP
ncbi:MAG: multiheme c-type cytochrome [Mariprofundaceae bacterium]|nr:multiheme c-type cytochrome [Mariprofundaceae bacterium]